MKNILKVVGRGKGRTSTGIGIAAVTAALLVGVSLDDATAKRAKETPGVPPGTTLPDQANAPEGKGPPSWTGKAFRKGVVATTEPLAAELAARILENGGNAIDAAAVAQFVLNVVEPQSSGIGGGGFMMVHLARTGETFAVDTREETPSLGTPDMFIKNPLVDPADPFPFGIRSTSGIGVGVPGTLKGVAMALEQWGTISLADALQPAIEAAEDGIVVSSRLASSTTNGRLQSECDGDASNSPYDVARAVFRPGGDPAACGDPLNEGDVLVQPDLANTFRLIAQHGVSALYDCGSPAGIAQALVDTQLAARTVANPIEQQRLKGRMTCDDLAAYEAVVREPTVGDYRGYTIASMSPPSSGGLTVVQMLKMLERFPIGDEAQGFGFGAFNTLNVMQEAMRLAFADRSVWMGDTDVVPDLPVDGLINDQYVALRSASCPDPDPSDAFYCIEVGQRLTGIQAGDPRPYDVASAATPIKLAKLSPIDEEGVNTTHFSIVDKWGNVVSYTTTVESAWGTGLMVPGFGFLLNNELTDFNSVPTANADPNNYNPGANDPAAFKRPRSSMAPTIMFKGDTPIVAYGSPGGSSIINTVFNMTLNLIDHHLDIQHAIDAPRLSLTSFSNSGTTSIEPGFDSGVLQDLVDLGYRFSTTEIGSVQAIVVDLQTGKQYGGADARRIGAVVGLPRPKNK